MPKPDPQTTKFKIGAAEYFDIAEAHGPHVAQLLWEKMGYKGDYVGWYVAVPGWVETTLGGIFGFEEHERASKILGDILNDAKTNQSAAAGNGSEPG